MSNIVFCGITPHPPILLPEVGGVESAKVLKTFEAMELFASGLSLSQAEVLIIISPHGPVFHDGIAINDSEKLEGDLRNFKANLEFEFVNDRSMVDEVVRQAERQGIVSLALDAGTAANYGISLKLDHGVLVPIYFLEKAGLKMPVVSIAMGMLPFEELYSFGAAIRKAAELKGKKVALIASGDLSHRLTPDAPAGYSPQGVVFDSRIMELLKNSDYKGIINIDQNLAEQAGECGLRTIIMMLGALDGQEAGCEVLSYEGPFGVGYLVAKFIPTGKTIPSLLQEIFQERKEKIEARKAGESLPVSIARKALEAFVKEKRKIYPDSEADPLIGGKAGVFVSLKKHGQLRGCIGTTMPTRTNIGLEIVNNAISAGTGDPRFDPVQEEELDELVYSVDILKAPEPIDSISALDIKRYGVIVRNGRRSGLLLPNLEGINSVEEQVAIARQKAGISPDAPVELERFEVVRYH